MFIVDDASRHKRNDFVMWSELKLKTDLIVSYVVIFSLGLSHYIFKAVSCRPLVTSKSHHELTLSFTMRHDEAISVRTLLNVVLSRCNVRVDETRKKEGRERGAFPFSMHYTSFEIGDGDCTVSFCFIFFVQLCNSLLMKLWEAFEVVSGKIKVNNR